MRLYIKEINVFIKMVSEAEPKAEVPRTALSLAIVEHM